MHCADIDKGGQESSSVTSGDEGRGPTFRGESRAGENPLRVALRFGSLVEDSTTFERNANVDAPSDWDAFYLHAEEHLLDLDSGTLVIVQEYVKFRGMKCPGAKKTMGLMVTSLKMQVSTRNQIRMNL